jgi:hypothetical protein
MGRDPHGDLPADSAARQVDVVDLRRSRSRDVHQGEVAVAPGRSGALVDMVDMVDSLSDRPESESFSKRGGARGGAAMSTMSTMSTGR